MDVKLLKQLCEIHAPSGNETRLKDFLLRYVHRHSKKWKSKPEVIHGDEFQDCIILKFGNPRAAIFAHMDSVGFTVRYFNQLLPIGSPEAAAGTRLVGTDSLGPIDCELHYDNDHHATFEFGRPVDRGTDLTYRVDFKDMAHYVQSPSLDNRVGIYVALKVAETLRDGAICFSCSEEHGGGTVPFLIKYMFESWQVRQALVADMTWVTDGIHPGKGAVVSLRDRSIPRKAFTERIAMLARKFRIDHQLEVEGMGSSDGRELQASPYPIDWCFVGTPQLYPHTPTEKVHKYDIECMIALYEGLMAEC